MLRIIDQRKPRVNLIVDEDESRRFHFTKRTFMRSLKTLFPPGRSGRSGARIKYGSAEDKLETNALNLLVRRYAELQNQRDGIRLVHRLCHLYHRVCGWQGSE